MKISTKGRYALRLALDVAAHGDEPVCLKDAASRQKISEKYLEKIACLLVKAGVFTAQRGASGGYRLQKAPEECSVGEILSATENAVAPVACLETEKDGCQNCDSCVTMRFFKGLDDVVNDYLYGTTLAELLRGDCKR